jgi:hypothetical protein
LGQATDQRRPDPNPKDLRSMMHNPPEYRERGEEGDAIAKSPHPDPPPEYRERGKRGDAIAKSPQPDPPPEYRERGKRGMRLQRAPTPTLPLSTGGGGKRGDAIAVRSTATFLDVRWRNVRYGSVVS